VSTIAFLGLGNMGGPMAANLVVAGHTVRAFDLVPALKSAAAEKGAQVFDIGADAVADAEVVITSLPNCTVVKSCYDEVLPAAKPGTLFIGTSTISVDDARTINAQPLSGASRNSTHRCRAA
jgi:3-hydroxyisobutyrate dehydrogenase